MNWYITTSLINISVFSHHHHINDNGIISDRRLPIYITSINRSLPIYFSTNILSSMFPVCPHYCQSSRSTTQRNVSSKKYFISLIDYLSKMIRRCPLLLHFYFTRPSNACNIKMADIKKNVVLYTAPGGGIRGTAESEAKR